eukprot:GHVO01029495.1.p1 GENE.GHVO01029495.1~~GHVO01029495.1.p1  ORF type:complete len:138 (+),score=29.91 GHVO01029495.1:26-415(+)
MYTDMAVTLLSRALFNNDPDQPTATRPPLGRSLLVVSGASTVAIDNKIEQAMDLVKSHLMFAVREEVDILKEQIKELLEKNSQLEMENSLLRSSASPETLSQLPPSAAAASANAAANAANATQPPTSAS